MLHLKKYFSEGLVQVAILLSLCGMMVDVGLEPYLPPSWQEMIRGPTSALTQTQFHNPRNRLEDGQDLHPKSVDLDGFFTARRLLGSVRSLDRLQVPQTELEAWLVQREPDPLPVDHQDQLRPAPPVDPRPGFVSLHGDEDEDDEEDETGHVLFRGSAQEDDGEEEDLSRLCRRAEGGGPEDRGESTQTDDQTSVLSLESWLLEETFPFTEEHQLNDGGDGGSDVETLSPPIVPSGNPSADLEMHWQDLLAIMEPTPMAEDVDMITSPDLNQNQRPTEPEALQRNNHHDAGAEAQHGFTGQLSHPELESLTSIAELDQQSAALNPPQHANLLAQLSSGEFIQGQNAEDSGAFSTDLLDMESSLYTSYYQSFENFEDPGLADSSVSSSSELSDELGTSPSSVFLFEQEGDAEDEESLLSPLGELLEDELRLLDLALEEGLSPEMTARLEEEGYLEPTTVKEETGGGEDQFGSEAADQQNHHQQDDNTEADSDSGLSLDFSHSPASPCASEASSYSSSSSSSSSVGSPFSEDEDKEDDEGSFDSEMEDEVTVKQEELDEEEMGAVGGEYPGDVSKAFSCDHEDHKVFNSLHWAEHIGHDHTYNQPRSSPGKTKPSKSISQHDSKPYLPSSSRHMSDARMWSRDERRARALKVPFTNEMIVNLPVDEFNDLLDKYTLSEEQLALIRDIRRRGKNKIAAQNCRRRKMDVLLGLKDDVAGLRRYRSRLLREKQEALRSLQEMKRQLGILYQEVFSRLRDEAGRPLDAMEYLLQFEPSGGVMVASRQQRAVHPLTKTSKKQKDKKK